MSEQQPFPAEGPDDAAYTGEDDDQDGGQVSEVDHLDPDNTDTPLEPSDATAGGPDRESGDAQEGEAGPNAVPEGNAESNEYDKE